MARIRETLEAKLEDAGIGEGCGCGEGEFIGTMPESGLDVMYCKKCDYRWIIPAG
jgi:hypothetical protein